MTDETEGIVLRSTPFQDYDRILTLFTPYHGLLKLFAKGRKKETPQARALTTPLTRAHYHYRVGKGELHRLAEGTLLNQHLALRDHLETLETAQDLTSALLASQWAAPAPPLYQLYCTLLERLPTLPNPRALVPLFHLKILLHEGLLHLTPPAHHSHRYGGATYSPASAPPGAHAFTDAEQHLLTTLALSRSLAQVTQHPLPDTFSTKIAALFAEAVG